MWLVLAWDALRCYATRPLLFYEPDSVALVVIFLPALASQLRCFDVLVVLSSSPGCYRPGCGFCRPVGLRVWLGNLHSQLPPACREKVCCSTNKKRQHRCAVYPPSAVARARPEVILYGCINAPHRHGLEGLRIAPGSRALTQPAEGGRE